MKNQNDIELDLLLEIADKTLDTASDWVLGGGEITPLLDMLGRVAVMIGTRMESDDHGAESERAEAFNSIMKKLSSLDELVRSMFMLEEEGKDV